MKKRWIMTLGVVVAGMLLFLFLKGDSNQIPTFESTTVLRGDISNEVSVTGHVQPVTRIDLAFTLSGRVLDVSVAEGDRILAGEPMARLESDVIQSQVREAQARLSRELAVEQGLLAPLRSEERAIKNTAVASAEIGIRDAEQAARATLGRVFTYADDAIEEKADELFYGARGPNPKFGVEFTYGTTKYIISADSQTASALSSARGDVEDALGALRSLSESDARDVRERLPEALAQVITIETFLNNLAGTINRYIPTDTGAQTVYESYQTTVASARSAIATARMEIVSAQQAFETAHATLIRALNDLDLSLAGATSEALLAQAAAVSLAENGVASARAQAQLATLRAPFTGTLALLDLTPGEVVSAHQAVGQFIGEGQLELEVYIPEADIAGVELGDTARVTFDAFEKSDVYTATVVRIALGESVRDGVPTYKTILHVASVPRDGLLIRPGMTVDVDILTDARQDVLFIPSRSVVSQNGRTFVRIWNGDEIVERDIEVGLKGSSGTTEVVSGLTEREEVILFVEES